MLRFTLALLLAGTLGAQVTVVASCDYGTVTAGNAFQSMPNGPLPTSGRTISASDRNGNCSASAALSAIPLGSGVVFDASATAVADSICYYYGAASSGNFVAELTAPQPVAGTVSIFVAGTSGRFIPIATCDVDVGDDRSDEFHSPDPSGQQVSFAFHTVIGPAPLRVRIRLGASVFVSAGWSDGGSIRVALTFTPSGTGWLTSVGGPCGASLGAYVARAVNTKFGFEVSGAPVTRYAFLVVGLSDLQLAVPPTMCVLRTDILVPVPVQIGPGGTASVGFALPNTVQGAIRAQLVAATIDAQGVESWWTSNAIRIALP